MAQLVCPTCGTSYDTSGFTPGQRFRCRGDGCTNKLTVPGGGGSGSGGETPTPAGGQPTRRPTGQAKKPSGVVKTAVPAAAVPADEDVLEPKVPTTKAKRGDTGRRAKPPSDRVPAAGPAGRGRGAPPKAASPAPLYAAIGGVLLILLIVVIMIFSKGDPAPRPRRDKPQPWKSDAPPVNTSTVATEQPKALDVTMDHAPKDAEKPKARTKKTYRFVEKDGVAARLDPLYDKLLDEDPNVAGEAAEQLSGLGADAIPVVLNKIDALKYNSMKNRTLGFHLMEFLQEHAPEALDDEKLSETLVVNPRDSGMHSFQDAARDWRAYFRDQKGLAAADAEIPD